MPVTIQLTGLKYKNSQGQFQSADCLKGEDADISIIAPDYSELTFPVNAGKLCTHDLKLYRAKQEIPTSENWTESHWDERTIEEELAAKYTKPAGGIPASDLADGVIPDIIDDEAGAGDTDVTFSADKLTSEFDALSNALNQSNAATNSDIGKAHSPKTVVNGQVTEWQYVPVGGGGGSGRTLLGEVVVSGTYIEMQMLSIDCATGIITVDDASGLPDSQIGVYSGRVHLIRKDLSAKLDTLPSELNTRMFFSIQKISDTTIKLGGSSLYDSYTETSTIDVTKWGIMVLNSNGTARIEISGLEIKDHMHVEIYTPTTNPDESIALKVYNQNNYDIFQSGSHERITAFFGPNSFEFVGTRSLPVTNGGIQNPKHGCGFPMWAFIDIRKTGDYIRYSWEINWALTSGVSTNCGYTKDIQTVLSTNKGISKFSADIGNAYDGFVPGSFLRVWEVND